MNYYVSRQCPPGTVTYTIKAGDTFFSLAQRFNTTIAAIIAANPDVDPENLEVGNIICMPQAVTPPATCPANTALYTIRPGDTFYSLTRRFNTKVAAIMAANPNVNPEALMVVQRICIPITGVELYTTYTNRTYRVTFKYPTNWRRVTDVKYEGATGFFQIDATSAQNINQACRNEAFHELNPYGSEPRIRRTRIIGQRACLIFPSDDQPAEMKEQAAAVIRYLQQVEIGGQTYNFFILRTDKDHLL